MTEQSKSRKSGRDAWLKKGMVLADRYELARPLGSGGWGQVYLARDRVLGRQVAVKRLLPSLAADANAVSRFHREASVIASVQDPHVLTIFDVLQEANEHFIVMEYADAGTLSQALTWEGTFNPFEALSVAVDICRGLRAVHNRGIIHRDIKPANVMFFSRSDGFPFSKLGDFGIALQSDEQRLTPSNKVLGTLIYLSPEQVATHSTLTPASDLYSLGVIMFEMLAGQLDEPFFLRRVTNQGEQQGLEYFATFPEPLQPTLYRALQQKPTNRFQSADEMLQALERTRGRLTSSLATQRFLEETIAKMRHAGPPPVSDSNQMPSPTPATPPEVTAVTTPATATAQPASTGWLVPALLSIIVLVVTVVVALTYSTISGSTAQPAAATRLPATAIQALAVRSPTATATIPFATNTPAVTPTATPTNTPATTPRPSATPRATAAPTSSPNRQSSLLAGPASLELVFRDAGVRGNEVIRVPASTEHATVDYQENRIMWGEAVTTIGSRTFQLDRQNIDGAAAFLPEQFRLEIDVSPTLQAAFAAQAGLKPDINSRRGDFWVGQFRCGSAIPPGQSGGYVVTIQLTEGNQARAQTSVAVNILPNDTCFSKAETPTPTPRVIIE